MKKSRGDDGRGSSSAPKIEINKIVADEGGKVNKKTKKQKRSRPKHVEKKSREAMDRGVKYHTIIQHDLYCIPESKFTKNPLVLMSSGKMSCGCRGSTLDSKDAEVQEIIDFLKAQIESLSLEVIGREIKLKDPEKAVPESEKSFKNCTKGIMRADLLLREKNDHGSLAFVEFKTGYPRIFKKPITKGKRITQYRHTMQASKYLTLWNSGDMAVKYQALIKRSFLLYLDHEDKDWIVASDIRNQGRVK